MLFGKLANLVGPRVGNLALRAKFYAPEAYLAAGVVAGVGAAIMLAKAHKKSEAELDEAVLEYRDGQDQIADFEEDSGVELNAGQKFEIMALSYRMYATTLLRLYGPGVLMGVSAVGFVLASHGVLKGRQRALMATAAILQQSFTEYRKRVQEEVGSETEERLYYGAEERSVTRLVTDEDGKARKRKGKENHIPEKPDPMMYSRLFDETNREWKQDPKLRVYWLEMTQQHMNDYLRMRGHVLLNDVYDALGFSRTSYGALVGWSNQAYGDEFIDFGLTADINQRPEDGRYLLDFNVHGEIFHLIGLG